MIKMLAVVIAASVKLTLLVNDLVKCWMASLCLLSSLLSVFILQRLERFMRFEGSFSSSMIICCLQLVTMGPKSQTKVLW